MLKVFSHTAICTRPLWKPSLVFCELMTQILNENRLRIPCASFHSQKRFDFLKFRMTVN